MPVAIGEACPTMDRVHAVGQGNACCIGQIDEHLGLMGFGRDPECIDGGLIQHKQGGA